MMFQKKYRIRYDVSHRAWFLEERVFGLPPTWELVASRGSEEEAEEALRQHVESVRYYTVDEEGHLE